MEAYRSVRVALVHDWLTGMRGGEKCLEALCRRWPQAHLYTLLHKKGSLTQPIEDLEIRTSFLQRLPSVDRYYRYLLPLMPFAAAWRIADCDLVVSSSHCVAKAALPPPGVPHVCYCFTPMRYAWHMREAYFAGRFGRLKSILVDRLMARLREWDRNTAERVTHFVAISQTVKDRISDCYGRDSTVIYPPVDTDYFVPGGLQREDYYLIVSAMAPYKRIDLAIEACHRLGRRLVVIGSGQDAGRLRALAGPETQFLGWQPDEAIRRHLQNCRALLFPGEEDFGIVPVEAMACGTPVIAYDRGGATETVLGLGRSSTPTGVFFTDQNADSLIEAIQSGERVSDVFQPSTIRRQALRFNKARFERELFGMLEGLLHSGKSNQRLAA